MTIKLANISDWQPLESDKLLVLKHKDSEPRRVRLEVNCGSLTSFHLIRKGKDAFHLATLQGLDVIEFWDGGELKISAARVDGKKALDSWYYTADGQEVHFDELDEETFTRIAERRARNPQLEYMEYMAGLNIQRRMDAMAADFERRMEDKYARGDVVDPETGEVLENPNKRATAGARPAKESAASASDNKDAGAGGGGDDDDDSSDT